LYDAPSTLSAQPYLCPDLHERDFSTVSTAPMTMT